MSTDNRGWCAGDHVELARNRIEVDTAGIRLYRGDIEVGRWCMPDAPSDEEGPSEHRS